YMFSDNIVVGSDTPTLASQNFQMDGPPLESQPLLLSNNNNGTSLNSHLDDQYQYVKHQNSFKSVDDYPSDSGMSDPLLSANNGGAGSSSPSDPGATPSRSSAQAQFFLFLTVCISVLSTLEFGYNTGVISPTMPTMQEIFKFTKGQKSFLVSIILVGAMVGSFVSGFVSDRIGRRWTLFLNNIFYLTGPLLTSFATNYSTLLAGRIITGFAVGVASAVVPTYISEVAPHYMRGALGLLRQSTITFGIMVSSLVAYGLVNKDNGWRYTFAIATVPSFIQVALIYWFLETPRFLVSKNRVNDAFNTIRKLDTSLPTDSVNNQIQKIKNNILEQQGTSGWSQLFKKKFLRVYFIGFGISMFQQFVGINCVIYYSTAILEAAGFNKNTAILISALVGIPQLIMMFISVWLIDRFGRRPLLLIGNIGQIVGLGILGGAFWGLGSKGVIHSTGLGWMAVFGMVFFKLMYAVGMGPIPLMVAAEIYPTKIRGKAVSIASTLNWLANFIMNISFPYLQTGLGQTGTYWLFGGISFLCFLFVYFFVPETKGVTIEELSKQLVKE
ncbi:hypothetical protein SAMD00019534_088910, partial [Acytostelium subglobosum LB1]|uniref:hypothetical protein n=1 Tax=Acytostelium subglobosum LB1 TaxID=1410327 RepID=UPI000644CC7C